MENDHLSEESGQNLKTNSQLEEKIAKAKQADDEKNQQQSKADQKDQKIQELTDALQRYMADMQNIKRRADEDRIRSAKFANTEFLKLLLPVIDNSIRGVSQVPDNLKEEGWVKGVLQNHEELMSILSKIGVQKMKTVGEKLDPNRHEALMQAPGKKDVIIEEFDPGYLYHDAVLKAAKVKVGNGS